MSKLVPYLKMIDDNIIMMSVKLNHHFYTSIRFSLQEFLFSHTVFRQNPPQENGMLNPMTAVIVIACHAAWSLPILQYSYQGIGNKAVSPPSPVSPSPQLPTRCSLIPADPSLPSESLSGQPLILHLESKVYSSNS